MTQANRYLEIICKLTNDAQHFTRKIYGTKKARLKSGFDDPFLKHEQNSGIHARIMQNKRNKQTDLSQHMQQFMRKKHLTQKEVKNKEI
jgi:hypothetical protein